MKSSCFCFAKLYHHRIRLSLWSLSKFVIFQKFSHDWVNSSDPMAVEIDDFRQRYDHIGRGFGGGGNRCNYVFS